MLVLHTILVTCLYTYVIMSQEVQLYQDVLISGIPFNIPVQCNFSFTWLKNGSSKGLSDENELVIPSVQFKSGDFYRCQIKRDDKFYCTVHHFLKGISLFIGACAIMIYFVRGGTTPSHRCLWNFNQLHVDLQTLLTQHVLTAHRRKALWSWLATFLAILCISVLHLSILQLAYVYLDFRNKLNPGELLKKTR